ncbi:hypothetical protein GCM10010472_14120 [Pseudonocardia halophobica]|uniref:Uncharacterized protein n=1 Tax=Pseudonocardia halophobica TaxID=29401 RepID=A0A9W6L6K0_9PSEU|nr:hypothetical protein [Pseudonocardia halophobica]GLL12876.1 hypothetical protein GCM10017577_40180 [Pseudonocardia halophobica]
MEIYAMTTGTTGTPRAIAPAGVSTRLGVAPSLRRPRGGWPFAAFRVVTEKQVPQVAVIADHNWTGVSVPNGLCRRRS